MTKPRPVGRPSLGKTPTERLELRIDTARRARWQKAANRNGVTLAEFIRECVDAAIR